MGDPSLADAAVSTCARLGEYAEHLTRHAPLPGGAIAIAGRDGLLAETTFGLADLERGLPVTSEHLFEIGSISKVFTSMLINQLADSSVLSLDERIDGLLPWVDLGQGRAAPTVRELLSHMSGIIVGSDALPGEDMQVWQLRDREVGDPSGAKFHYSNVGYVMLGLAAAARTGRPFPELVHDELLVPMGMHRALPAITHAVRSSLAVGYVPAREDRPWVPGDDLAPAPWLEATSGDGNIAANAADLARLATLLLREGEIDGRRVCSAETIRRMTTPTAIGGEPIEHFDGLPPVNDSRYGLGINVERVAGNTCVTHGGGMVGYSTFLLVDLTAQVGVVVLTNSNGENLYAQMLARAAHADLLSRIGGTEPVELPDPDPRLRPGVRSAAGRGPAAGRFVRAAANATGDELSIRVGDDAALLIDHDGATGSLYRTLPGRIVTDHPALRAFHLDFSDADGIDRWTHGPDVWLPSDAPEAVRGAAEAGGRPDGIHADLVGQYRTFSPWFPTLRIVWREGQLLLTAPGGVEAPSDEELLVEVQPGTFRVGADPWLPERLVAGPVVDGRAIWVSLDGCVYSRT